MKNITSNEPRYKDMNWFHKSWMIPTPAYKKGSKSIWKLCFRSVACSINEADLYKAMR